MTALGKVGNDKPVEIVLVAAMAENRVIGRSGGLPWRLPKDLAHFKAVTMGHDLIMGRRTWESIGARPLPGRRSIVITRSAGYPAAGAQIVRDPEEALAAVVGEVACVVGGGEVYRAFLPRADRLEITIVHAEVDGDTTFPEWDASQWTCAEERAEAADERHAYAMTFRTLVRVR